MSRGLGKLQRDILATLNKNSRPLFAHELAWVLHNEEKDERDYSNPPEAFVSSIRRAIRGLKQKGLVDCTRGTMQLNRLDDGRGLVCWLPGQDHKIYQIEAIPGEEAEAAILAALEKFNHLEEWEKQYYSHSYEAGWIEYKWVISRGKEYLEARLGVSRFAEADRLGMALNRAVKRLAQRGQIKAYWRDHKGRYAWVVNVSKLENN